MNLTTFTRDTLISCWVYCKHYLPVKPLTSKPSWKALPVKPHVWQWSVEMLPDMFVYFYFTQPFLSFHSFLLIYTCLIHPSIHPSIQKRSTVLPAGHEVIDSVFIFHIYLHFFEGQKYLITAAPSGIDFQQQFLQAQTSHLSIRSTDNQSAL